MKPPRLRRALALLICLLAGFQAAQAQSTGEPPRIAKIIIKHVGPRAANDDFIRSNIHVKEGDLYVRASSDDDVQNLYRTGYFYNIKVTQDITPDGVVLTFFLQRNLQITTIKFEGNKKFSDRKLLKYVKSKTGAPMKEPQLFTDAREMQKQYQKAGYPGTTVDYRFVPDENTGKCSVTFDVKEGVKIRIDNVRFEGAQAFSQRTLRKEVKTRRRWLFSWLTGSGVKKEDVLDEDKERLTDFYRQKGYIDFELKEVKQVNTGPNRMQVVFEVSEGRPYKVGAISFTGKPLFSDEEIRVGLKALHDASRSKKDVGPHGLEMDVGNTFTPLGMANDVQAVEDFYGARGYLEANPNEGGMTVNRIPNTDTGTMDLEFKMDPGEKSYVERVDIKGNWKTKDKVIRRELAISPGEVFSTTRVKLSTHRLEGLQFFEKVDARPEPTGITDGKNLSIAVEEKSTGNFSVGAGFSSVDSIVGYVEVSQGNFDLFKPPTFTGGGQKFRLRAQVGTRRQDYELSFIEPWFLNHKLALGADLYYRDLNFQSLQNLYDERRIGARLSLTRTLGSDFLLGSVSYTIEEVGIIPNKELHGPYRIVIPGIPPQPPQVVNVPGNAPQAILNEEGNTLLPRAEVSLAYDTRNDTKLPNHGGRTELTIDYVGGYLGGGKDFYKVELRSAWYFPGFAKGHVLELTGFGGTADSLDSHDVPFYERYYLGGADTLRGYRYREISPREPGFKEPIGGDTYWFGSAEYSLPIIDRLRFALFYDIGNVTARPYDFSFKDFADNWGLGFRLDLPIGPLKLDYGIPINHPNGVGGSGRFQFGVGYRRNF